MILLQAIGLLFLAVITVIAVSVALAIIVGVGALIGGLIGFVIKAILTIGVCIAAVWAVMALFRAVADLVHDDN